MEITLQVIQTQVSGNEGVYVPLEIKDEEKIYSGPEGFAYLQGILKPMGITLTVESISPEDMNLLGYKEASHGAL